MAVPRHRILPTLLLLAACASPPAGPRAPVPEPRLLEEPLEVEVRERFYPVEGVSASRLNAELAVRGPAFEGRRWHALTDFALRWRYVPRVREGRCAAEDVRIQVQIVTTLPRWRDRTRAAPELASDWELYMHRLRQHEAGHQRIVMRQGRALLARVEGLEASDCATLADRTRRLARRTRGVVNAAHDAWDRRTGYGIGGG